MADLDPKGATVPRKRRNSLQFTRLRPSATVKYKKYEEDEVEADVYKVPPSTLLRDVHQRSMRPQATAPKSSSKPRIVELLNIADFSHHIECAVPIGEPIFQPFPTVVSFSGYEPFKTYESVLYLRNNDNVGRRVKVLPPNSPFFTVAKLPPKRGSKEAAAASGATIAPGIEVAYVVRFQPTSPDDASCDLVICTEREKFVVPVRALGRQPALDVPDVIEFETVPCKSEVRRTFQVANIGQQPAHFAMHTSPSFSVTPSEGQLSPGESLQCTVTFCPEDAGEVRGDLEVVYDSGHTTTTQLIGNGREVEVEVSAESVDLLPTYMNKESQKSFKIFNRSDTVVRFSMRQHPTPSDDSQSTANRIADMYATHARTLSAEASLPAALLAGTDEGGAGADGDGNSTDEEEHIITSELVLEARTLKQKRRQLLTEKPLFRSSHFKITPLEGTIWPGGEVEVTVQFSPERHAEYTATAYLDITGRANRLPIALRGLGLGPKAMFSYDVLDVGDTYIHTVHQYEIEFHNRGEVPAEYRIVRPDTYFGKMFEFEPSKGVVGPESVQVLQCRFLSDTLGEFAETFRCDVTGSSRPLTLDFRGQVVGPSFILDNDDLDFGSVSYGFPYRKELVVTNTCEIPMRFTAYMDRERDPSAPEFHITPGAGVLAAGAQTTLTVEFVAHRVAKYVNTLLIDVPGVGRRLRSVPVRAQSFVPEIKLTSDSIDYGDCFLQFPYKQLVTLVNDSKLPAKFEVLPQDDQSKNLGIIRCDPAAGGIPAMGKTAVSVVLSTARRGRMQLPVRIRIQGASMDPLECVMNARSIGPALEFFLGDQSKEKRSTRAHMDFGSCPVLKPNTRVLNIYNPCPVPASYKAFIESPTSVFSINPREGMLQPGAVLPMDVTCLMDDTRKFTEVLHILVQDGDNVAVPLSAVGTGTCIVADGVKDGLDFGKQLVGRPFDMKITLRNMGRRPQTVAWHNTMKDVIAKMIKQKQNQRKKKDAAPEEEPSGTSAVALTSGSVTVPGGGTKGPEDRDKDIPEMVFSVAPDRVLINPKQAQEFIVTGLASTAGSFSERMHVRATMGSVTKDVIKTDFHAECTPPLLETSSQRLTFTYAWTEGSILAPMEETLRIKNITELPLYMSMRTLPPFTVDRLDVTLGPGEEDELLVEFDPGFRTDRQTTVISGKLQISYADCPHKDQIDLVGEINFPNLKLQAETLDFGCVLTDTIERRYFTITNVSSVPAAYEWALAAQYEEEQRERKSGPPLAPPGEVFDVLPTQGLLEPGASERIEVSYFARPGAHSMCWAVCNVTGGPSYEVRVSAESSHIRYTVDKHLVDIGRQQYNRASEQEVVINNTGRVPFNYVVNLSKLSRPSIVSASPAQGTIGPGHRDAIRLRVTPGIPDRIAEEIVLEIAHCEPEVIRVVGEGTFQGLVLSLPRMDESTFRAVKDAAREHLAAHGPRLHPADMAALVGSKQGQGTAKGRAGTSGAPQTARLTATGGRVSTIGAGDAEGAALARGRSGFIGGGYEPTALEVDIEADRRSLCRLLMERLAGGASDTLVLEPSAKSMASAGSAPRKPSVIVAHYLLDLGHITKGTSKSRKFRLQNTAPTQISLSIDRRTLQASGMTIEPEKLAKLAEYGTANFTLTMDTAMVPTGAAQCIVPVEIKGGPSVLVTIKSNVVIPELTLSRELLDFGPVQAGHCKIITVQLHNPKEVPCDWQVKKPMESDTDWSFFECQPDAGLLPPGESANMKVVFTPARGREHAYAQRIPIRIAHNPKQVYIQCNGRGLTVQAVLSSTSLDLAAILPAKEGEEQKPNIAQVELINPSSEFPIEVFSLDFDEHYREEEEALQVIPAYGELGLTMAAPRLPGQEFWPEFRELAAKVVKEKEEEERRAKEERERREAGEEAGDAAGEEAPVDGADGAEGAAAQQVGELEGPAEDPAASALYLVVAGPPGSGKTTVATRLGDRYEVPVVTLPSLLEEAAGVEIDASQFEEGSEEREEAVAAAAAVEKARAAVAAVAEDREVEPLDAESAGAAMRAVLRGDKYARGFVLDGLDGGDWVTGGHAAALGAVAVGAGLKKTEVMDEKGKPTGKHVFEGAARVRVACLEIPPAEITARLGGAPPSAADDSAEAAGGKPKKGPSQKSGKSGSQRHLKVDKKGANGTDLGLDDAVQARYAEWEGTGTVQALSQAQASSSGGDDVPSIEVTPFDGVGTPDEVFNRVVGIEFDHGALKTRLPSVAKDKYLVPPDYTLEIIKRPRARPKRVTPSHFELFTVRPEPEDAAEKRAKAAAGKPKSPDVGQERPGVVLQKEARWVLGPGEKVLLEVHFRSKDIGSFTERFGFESRGGNQLDLTCKGTCAYPQISTDYRNVFYRKAKARPSTPAVSKQYVIGEEVFDFGPLLAGRSKEGHLEGSTPENAAQFRITNNGLFDLRASFWLKSTVKKEGEPGLPESAEFIIHPSTLELKVDETKDLQVFAFPSKPEQVADSIVCSVDLNPTPTLFNIRAVGTKPAVEVAGIEDMKAGIKFQRLLLGKRDVKTFELRNTSLLPVKWSLDKVADLPPELMVTPFEGVLPARESAPIRVEFSSKEARNVQSSVVVKVQDEKAILPAVQDIPIALSGEAYSINTDVQYPAAEYQGVDFGTIRVWDADQRSIVVSNTGKYEIAFNVGVRSGPLKELLTVEPASGKINPNGKQEIKINFNAAKTLRQEVTVVDVPTLTLQIIEPLNSNTETTVPIPVRVKAVLSKYSITPARGLNFGPHVYNTESQPRVVNVRNDGDFPFTLALFKLGTPVPDKAPDGKGAATLQVGQFVFDPAVAIVQPGQVQQVKVTFKAEGRQQFAETVGIHVSERDHADCPDGIPYEVAGESCIPGINAEDVAAIFEEHRVLPAMDPFHPMSGVYATREKVFDFGAVIARLGESEGSEAGASFKISNPIKVPCTVGFKVAPRGADEKDKDKDKAAHFPMTVEPARLNIPPHEFRYVTVKFSPSAIQQYEADFVAEVENGGDPKTASLSFELRGEGVLPHLSIVQPTERDAAGRPLLKFPRSLPGRESAVPIVVRNDGSIDTTARLEAPPNVAFLMQGGAGLFTLTPGETRRFQVVFKPPAAGDYRHEFGLGVRHNPFEQVKVVAEGECFAEDVIFTALPGDSSDELRFPDAPIGVPQEVLFNVKNVSRKYLRYRFDNLPDGLRVTPSGGIVHPGQLRPVQATLRADAALKLEGHEVSLHVEEVKFDGEPFEWSEDAPATRQASPTPDGKTKGRAATPPATGGALPAGVSTVANTGKTLPLRVHAVVDSPRFEADRTDVSFKPTMMFQTRSYSFPIRNTSEARLDFSFKIEHTSGEVDTAGPFKVSPERGSIGAGDEALITVRFSPKEVEPSERVLVCMIPHLPEDAEPLVRRLSGSVLRPWCHFELPESDYLSAGRRNPEMPDAAGNLGPLDPSTRVLEMESLGLKVRNTKRFYVLNPTSVTYEFVWEPVGVSAASDGPFVCQTRRGVVAGGRRYEMVFSYVPEVNQLQESHWIFKIPQQGIQVPFLIVGHVKEPQVILDRSAINFGLVQVGGKVRETIHIVNEEAIPFEFAFDKSSFEATAARIASTGQQPTCQFAPLSGSVPPNGRLPVTVTFEPHKEGMHNYNVVCNVRRKPTRLTLNVKGEGFEIRDSLSVDTTDGHTLALSDVGDNQVDFGQVIINERSVKQMALVNSGAVAFEFLFNSGDNPNVVVTPPSGRVGPGDRLMLDLSYEPKRPEELRGYPVTCQIVNGRKYRLSLHAVGHRPRLDLSTFSHNFGPQLIVEGGVRPARAVIRATNNDKKEISFDCLYENTQHLHVECPPTVLQPGQTQDIEIFFSPREERAYKEAVPFEINGLVSVSVSVSGTGTPLRLALADKSHAVNLGSARVGQQVSRTVKVRNGSPVAVDLDLSPAAEALAKLNVDISPAGSVVVRGKETLDLTLIFRPPVRQRPFTHAVEAVASGHRMMLFQLSGACLGTEVKLASDSIPFGAVVIGSMITKRLQLENTGDVGTKFTWDTGAFGKHFRISPTSGFIAAGQDVKLDVTFEPTETNPDIRVEHVRLMLDGCDDQFLTMTGACVEQEAQPEKLNFQVAVREVQEKTINVKNPSASDWLLRPVIHNDAWSGAEFLTVPAGKQQAYTIKYQPMRMAEAASPHTGSVFFPLPNGLGLLYQLTGTAGAPSRSGEIKVTAPAKQAHHELVKVSNWDKHNQRFAVNIELANRPKACVCDAPEYIDVPGLAERDLRLTLSNQLEGSVSGRVVCTNTTTGEYLFYDLSFVTTAPLPQAPLVLECPVRQKARAAARVHNPLPDPVTLDVKCSDPMVEVPAKVEVPGKSTGEVTAMYRPLLESEAQGTLTLTNADLGKFEFPLKLRGLPTGPERSVEFNVPLGAHEVRKVTVRHFLNQPCDYAVSFANEGAAGFSVPPGAVKAPAASGKDGVDVTVEVNFEPKAIGENFRDTLVLTSDKGGVYKCPLLGRCIPPKPRGPIDVKGGGGQVPFRNVFDRDTEYTLVVDNPSFVVKPTETVKAKTSTNFSVQYKPVQGAGTTGMLTVMCAESPSPWLFYLRAQ